MLKEEQNLELREPVIYVIETFNTKIQNLPT